MRHMPTPVRASLGLAALLCGLGGLLLAPRVARAQANDPTDTDRGGAQPRERPRPERRAATPPPPRTRAPAPRTTSTEREAPRRAAPPKAKRKKKRRKAKTRFYLGADLAFMPGMTIRRTILGKGEELMPKTTAITRVHTTSLRYVQGFLLMNRVLDLRLAAGVTSLQASGVRKTLWGSDFGFGVALNLYRRGRLALQLFNTYRLLIVTGPDEKVGFGLHFNVGVGATLEAGERKRVEVRVGYGHQQLTFEELTDSQVGGLETPTGIVLRTHLILLSFAFLYDHH